MSENLPATVERFTGFAGTYDRYRPRPPEALGEILPRLAGVRFPRLVVDLGCGTGLSTRFWAGRAFQVIGVDPSPDMLTHAKTQPSTSNNVSYLFGYGNQVGLVDDCADIVTISQALHWMEPESTLAEVTRLLRPGGIFSAIDFDFPPLLPSWEAELAYRAFIKRVNSLDEKAQVETSVPRWSKDGHLERLQKSGHFRFTRQFSLHHIELGDAERLVGGVMSFGLMQSLLKAGISERELGLETFVQAAQRTLGNTQQPWVFNAQVWVGIL